MSAAGEFVEVTEELFERCIRKAAELALANALQSPPFGCRDKRRRWRRRRSKALRRLVGV